MKKFLSLVLALVMTMSLVTVSAGAKDYTDGDKITYVEAVDVVSAIEIVDGYENGAFNPTNTLTRGAAAKIICNLILGPTTAAALRADTAPYKDVPTTNVFAGYIAYCQQQGIISGYADGSFRPTGTLTGYAFMKMLLGALGYDSAIEGFVGPNWSVQVGKLALGIGLQAGNDEFVGVNSVNREEACLYVFNTLQATMVDYDSKITVNNGDSQVVIGSSSAVPVTWTTGRNNDGNIARDGFVQFAEQYFTKLVLRGASDDFMRPANRWMLKADEIGTYSLLPNLTYTAKVSVGDIYKDLGLNRTVAKSDVEVYVDGVENDDQAPATFKKGSDVKYGGNGVLTEVFFNEDTGVITVVEVNTYVGEFSKAVAATSKKDAYIKIAVEDVRPAGAPAMLEFETEADFEDDAKVLYTYSLAAKAVESVEAAELVTGAATRTENKKNDMDENRAIYIDETGYKFSAKASGLKVGQVTINNDYDVYLDAYGYAIYVEEIDNIGNYALFMAAQNRSNFSENRALLVLADGTEKIVDTDKDYKANLVPGTIVTYREDDGEYSLKAVKQTNATAVVSSDNTAKYPSFVGGDAKAFQLTGSKAGVTFADADGYTVINRAGKTSVAEDVDAALTLTTNSKTIFVVYNTTDETYSVYEGIKNAPSINAAKAGAEAYAFASCRAGKMADVMFIFANSAAIEDSNDKSLFIAADSMSNLIHTNDGDYFEYAAVVNGEITTVKIDETVVKAMNPAGSYKSYITNNKGIITDLIGYAAYKDNSDALMAGKWSGIDKRSADYTVLLGYVNDKEFVSVITVDDDAEIFYVDKDGNISEMTYNAIYLDENDTVVAVVKDYMVQELYICEVADGEDAEVENDKVGSYKVKVVNSKNGNATVTVSDYVWGDVEDGAVATIAFELQDADGAFVAEGEISLTKPATSGRAVVEVGEYDKADALYFVAK